MYITHPNCYFTLCYFSVNWMDEQVLFILALEFSPLLGRMPGLSDFYQYSPKDFCLSSALPIDKQVLFILALDFSPFFGQMPGLSNFCQHLP